MYNNANIKNLSFKSCTLIASFFIFFTITYASSSVGIIDATNKITKVCQDTSCSTFGQVNFKPTVTTGVNPIVITDTSITGHAWGNQVGWINMNPTGLSGADVLKVNPVTGVITGKAFSNTGSWINFSPTGAGVTLVDNGSGSDFSGWAWVSGSYGGWMKFDCSSPATCVKTDWRINTNRSTTTPVVTPSSPAGSLIPININNNTINNTTIPPSVNPPVTSDNTASVPNSISSNINENSSNGNEAISNNGGANVNNNQNVKEVLPLSPETPAFPVQKNNNGNEVARAADNNNYREVFPFSKANYESDPCFFCILVRNREVTVADVNGNITKSGEGKILKYGFVPNSMELGVKFGLVNEEYEEIDMTSVILTLVIIYLAYRYLYPLVLEEKTSKRRK